MNHLTEAEVAIVGGGVIGCAIAWKLAREGVQVTVVERGAIGQEATWAAGGILAPQVEAQKPGPFLDLCLASRDRYPSFVEELISQSETDPALLSGGVLQLAQDDAELSRLKERLSQQRALGLPVEWCSPEEAHALEPHIGPVKGGLFFPKELSIDPRLLSQALAQAAARAGARFLLETEVRQILSERGRVVGLELGERQLLARKVVIAAGSWSSQLPGCELAPEVVEPVRGQMIVFKTQPPLVSRVVYSQHGYLIPRKDGRVLAGSTMERVGFQKEVTARGLLTLLGLSVSISPTLENASFVDCWAGLRPGTPDGLPILGPGLLEGLFWATGHFRNGILLAPITAELMADVILGRKPAFSLAPFSVERFS